MPGGRRGLVAPQNTFLDTLIKKASSQQAYESAGFLLANAQIVEYPIVYCSDEFTKLMGYPRVEVMQKSIRCDFMIGALTDKSTIDNMIHNLGSQLGGSYEILYYKRSGHGMWLQLEITPIRNEQTVVVLFLCAFRDITAFKEPLEGTTVIKNLSKFAKLAWTMTKSRQSHPTAEPGGNNHLGVSGTFGVQVSPKSPRSLLGGNGMLGGSSSRLRQAFTEAVPEYRHEPPKTPPHILLHYSPFKVVWDWLILFLTFYSVVMVPYNLAFNRSLSNDDITLLVIDSIVDLTFFIDIIFNFHTSFVGNDGAVIVDQDKIRRNYLRSGFVIDILACLPYDALNIFDKDKLFGNSDGTGSSGYSNIFSILKVMRLFRLGRVARALHRFLESSFALLLLMLSFYMIVAHWFACIWYVIGLEDLKNGCLFGWLSALANTTGKPFYLVPSETNDTSEEPEIEIMGGPPVISMYVTALYFTMTCMTSIGFGNVAASSDYEKTFCCCMMIISSLLYAAIFGHVTTIIHHYTHSTAKYHEMLSSVREFMMLNDVPKNLCERVVDYVVSKWTNTKGVDPDKVLSVCPKDMKADICVHLNRKVFNGCPAFRLASDGCLRALAVNFDMIHSAPGDFVVRKGESIKELGFVVSGSLEVIQDGEILAFLSQGDVFGDGQWRENTLAKSAVHVRALTYCDIHVISIESLKDVLEFYKAFSQTFSRNLTLTYDLSRRTVFYKVSDKRLEKILGEVSQQEPPLTAAQIMLLKRAVNKFKGQVTDAVSSGSDDRRKNSIKVLGSPKELKNRLLDRLNSARSVADRYPSAGPSSPGGAMATTVVLNHSPPTSTSHQSWTTALVEPSLNDFPGGANTFKRPSTRKKSSPQNRPVSPFEIPSPEHSKLEPKLEPKSVSFGPPELVETRDDIQRGLAQLEQKLGSLEALLMNLMERFPTTPTTNTNFDNINSNV